MPISETIYDKNIWDVVKNGEVGATAYNSAVGFNLVRIYPNLRNWGAYNRATSSSPGVKAQYKEMNKVVTGVMVNEFSYSLSSEWETIETPLSLIDIGIISDVVVAAGGGELGAVYKSKKLWKRSGYLVITPKIKIIDINGNGLPLVVTRTLLGFCTAITTDFEEHAQEIVGKVQDLATAGGEYMDDLLSSTPREADVELSTLAKMGDTAKAFLSEGSKILTAGMVEYMRGLEDIFSLKISPPPLIVEIGRIFKHEDMVLTQVSFTFSQEMTAMGPLYVEVDLTLETRTIINGGKSTGMVGIDKIKPTVDIVQGGNVVESNKLSHAPPPARTE